MVHYVIFIRTSSYASSVFFHYGAGTLWDWYHMRQTPSGVVADISSSSQAVIIVCRIGDPLSWAHCDKYLLLITAVLEADTPIVNFLTGRKMISYK